VPTSVPGKNKLIGGAGLYTARFGRANAAVTVDLTLTASQATGGSGSDT